MSAEILEWAEPEPPPTFEPPNQGVSERQSMVHRE